MFSEVAHHQGQNHSSYGSYFHPPPVYKNLSITPNLDEPRIGHQHTPAPNASFRQRARKSHRHARPGRSTVSLPQVLQAQTLCYAPPKSSEHMLRRKTPNGTLAAGYDGSPNECNQKPHTMKHLLSPTSDTPEQVSYTQKLTGNSDSHSSNHTSESLDSRTGAQLCLQAGADESFKQGFSKHDTIVEDGMCNQNWRPSAVLPEGMDSVLNQSSLHHHNHHFAGSNHMSTVLQPLWPPSLGFDSLHRSGSYGSYRLDEGFGVARTAPLHDPSNQGLQAKRETDLLYQTQSAVQQYDSWPHHYHNVQQLCAANQAQSLNQSFNAEKGALGSPTPDSRFPIQDNQIHSSPVVAQINDRPGLALAYRNMPSKWEEHGTKTSANVGDRARCDIPGFATSSLAVSETPTGSNNGKFKEKVLLWAQSIYGNLLASTEQTRRRSIGQQQQSMNQHQLNYYPQPSRRHLTSWLSTHERDDRSVLNASSSIPTSTQRGLNPSPRTLKYPSQGLLVNQSNGPSSRPPYSASLHDAQSRQTRLVRDARLVNHPVPLQPSYVPAQVVSDMHARTPTTAAIYAVELLSRLCQESELKWIDGMILAGCLAYGLGDYSAALNWYFKVLQQDSNNVEAMSNLAATLLAINRRNDAEHYWYRSIKVRPSYFEATEHLVGLLHEGQRGREAVKVIEFVEHALRLNVGSCMQEHKRENDYGGVLSKGSRSEDGPQATSLPGTADSGYAIPPSENGRMLALIHGKGNMLYQLGDNAGAAQAFEDAILIGAGRGSFGIRGLIYQILGVFSEQRFLATGTRHGVYGSDEPILLSPDMALETSRLVFTPQGRLPGLRGITDAYSQRAAISIVSNSLLSLAKIYQDGMSSSGASTNAPRATSGVQEILALYYLSLSLQPSPSTANNVGILLASVQQSSKPKFNERSNNLPATTIPGVIPGSGIALALAYYDYGLQLDTRHAHLYTNLGSLFKDIGQLQAAIKMYEKAVECDGNFDIALANLANAVKDQGRVSDAIIYYKRAVTANPDFAEAVCGLANALNSVCSWKGRGGIRSLEHNRDRWHVDDQGDLFDSRKSSMPVRGWIERVIAIVDKQLHDGEGWGKGVLQAIGGQQMYNQLCLAIGGDGDHEENHTSLKKILERLANDQWEGAKVVRLIERATKVMMRRIYWHQHIDRTPLPSHRRIRPQLPAALAVPSAPTVLPFHTFTCPLSAKQIRKISQRNGLRVSCSTLRAPWLPSHIFDPPNPPNPHLNIGYISSDFNNHPLAHLMQSVFGFHDQTRVKAFCYATTVSDGSIHRQQIEREAPIFHDASLWSIDRIVNQVVADNIHILINLNGYTRGAKNEVFAARPAPIQMSFMGFAGTLGAEWCDYLLADRIAIPPQTLRPWRRNLDLTDQIHDGNNNDDDDDWVYGENIIFARDTFFCCDHRQSAPDSQEARVDWTEEQRRRWKMRKDLFPDLADDAVILGNFNQLYKIEPTTFRIWLRILSRVPKAILWLLRFPELGEENLRESAVKWGSAEVAARIIFTDVAPKHQHISRARICDLFLDTPECNAHTTAADVLWSGTPLLTLPRYEYKMCSRMAASILRGALPKNRDGEQAAKDLIAENDEAYEEQAVELGSDLQYPIDEADQGFGRGRLIELRRLLYESRWTSALFDTRRWVCDLESAYVQAWRRWVVGEGGDIWL